MNDSEINSKSDVICLDPGRRVIASAWSPKTGFHILDKSEYYKKGGINLRKQEADKRNT